MSFALYLSLMSTGSPQITHNGNLPGPYLCQWQSAKKWQNGRIINPGKHRKYHLNKLYHNEKCYTDGHTVSNLMNDYFSSVRIKLQQQFRPVDNNLYEFAAPRLLRLFYISDISIQDIVTEISRLNTNKAVGSDNIGAKIIRMCPEIFAYSLAKIFNRAIEKAEYPTQLKIARVVALFKKGNHYLANNYHPICLLSSCNKIFEKNYM